MRFWISILAVAIFSGCSQTPILTSDKDVDAHVGKVVTIRGTVTNTKIPTILGVDVSSDNPDLRDQIAEATGLLQRDVVTHVNNSLPNRGVGTFYRLKAIDSDYSAQVRPVTISK